MPMKCLLLLFCIINSDVNSSDKEDKVNGLRGLKVAIANPMSVTVMNHFFAIIMYYQL